MIGKVKTAIFVLCMLVNGAVFAAEQNPQQLVRETTEHVLDHIEKHRAELLKDPDSIYGLINESILPHFDFRRMTQSTVGRHWRKATDDQKQRLMEEFQQLLIRTYAVALLHFSGERVEFLPVRLDPKATRVMIPTMVDNNGPKIPINYRLQLEDGGWKVYDLIIDGVSLVSNYRGSFRSVIGRQGIDGLIDSLASKNKKKTG